jgi:hypothetical protein
LTLEIQALNLETLFLSFYSLDPLFNFLVKWLLQEFEALNKILEVLKRLRVKRSLSSAAIGCK